MIEKIWNKRLLCVCIPIILLVVMMMMPSANCSWWLLGMPSTIQGTVELKPTNYKQHCNRLQYLVKRQRELCGLSQNVLKTVGLGAKMGIDECQYQFRMNRWNCSTFSNHSSVFGSVLKVKSREKAYIYAVSAAGVAYSITRACSKGEITECGCDDKVRSRPTKGRWEWGGCSEDIRFGEVFSKDFVDSRESENEAEGLMNIHNNEAGRRAIRSKMELVCKCHGVSGSCSVRVCWRKMAVFRQIGDDLTTKFEGASLVKLVKKKKKKLRPLTKKHKRPTRRDLVFLEESPDYCLRNESLGVLGTKGRLCVKTSYGMDGCSLLCCGRGYQTLIREVTEKCNCKFVWCCKVMCEQCTNFVEEHYCNWKLLIIEVLFFLNFTEIFVQDEKRNKHRWANINITRNSYLHRFFRLSVARHARNACVKNYAEMSIRIWFIFCARLTINCFLTKKSLHSVSLSFSCNVNFNAH